MATDPSGLIPLEHSGTWEHKALQWCWRVEMDACGVGMRRATPSEMTRALSGVVR